MTSISAFIDRAISASLKRNTAVYLIVMVAALAISGCGEDEKTPAQKLAESATSSVGPPGTTPADPGGTEAGSTGASNEAKKESSSKSKSKKRSNPDVQIPNSEKPKTESDTTEPARMALTINLKNGKFTSTTPTNLLVPTEIDVELDVYVQDNRRYTLTVVKAKGGGTESPIFPKKGYYTFPIGAMAEGQVATVKLGDETIKIKAGAEPGP